MKAFLATFLAAILVVQPVLAATAVTTANVNFRQGPGTGFASLGTLPSGTSVEMSECDDTGAWCAISVNGQNGFVAGSYLSPSEPEQTTGWPRSYQTDGGATLVLYQPQFTDWDNFTTLKALVAAEYVKDDKTKPVYGVIGLSGKSAFDGEEGNVIISDIAVTEIDFSALDRTALTDLTLQVGKLLPTGPITVKEERITASLAEYKRMEDVKGLNSEAPPIFIANEPSILLQTEGEPVLAPVKGVQGLQFVVNTNWDLLKLTDGGAYYLRDEKSWLTSTDLKSGWSPVRDLPDPIKALPDDDNWKETREAIPPQPFPDDKAPKVVYSDKPAEMIVFDGEPKLEPVPSTRLEWASNTDSDVFFLNETKTWYILVSGRWYKSASLDGPWTFTTPDLPADFQNIPEDAPYYSVRASVPNTSEAAQARLKASIPSTARVEVGSVSADVSYAGDPEFEKIEGTSMSYAVNTNDQVIQVGAKYYVLQDGVWFVGDSPQGPFQVATAVPDEIYTIPPSSPVYNTTYVRIYETEPGAVWYGYTMGYLTGYLAWGTFVYGSGWYYRPWYRPGPVPIFFPRPVTYGIGAFYNPVRGTFGRYGYAYGPRRGIAAGGIYNPRTGGYIRGAAISGPLGSAGFISAYNPRTGNRVIIGGGRGIYGNWKGGGVVRGGEWARTRDVAAGAANRWKDGGGPGRLADRRGNVFAGRDGSVYRRDGNTWQKFEGGRWSGVAAPSRDQISDRLGDVGAGIAAGGAGAAIGGALANRPNINRPQGDRPNINLPAQRPDINRPVQKPNVTRPAQKPNINRPVQKPNVNRPAQRPNVNRPTTRPATRPAQRPATRPATRPAQRPQAPAHLNRDYRSREVGNRQVNRQRNVQRSRPQARPQHRGGGGRGGGHRGGGRRR